MGKRGWKIYYSSIACLLACATVFTISVFAATRQSVSVGSTVKFTSTAVNATVNVSASGDMLNTASATVGSTTTSCLNNPVALANFIASETTQTKSSSLSIALKDNDNDLIFYAGETFTLAFTIQPATGTSKGGDLYYYFAYTSGSLFSVQYYDTTEDEYVDYSANAVTNVGGTVVSTNDVTITFQFTVISDFYVPQSDVSLGSFSIYLANSVANLNSIAGTSFSTT